MGARHTGEGGRQVSEGAGFALVDRSGEPVARDVRREHAVDDQVLVGDPDLREFRCGAGGFGERGRLCAGDEDEPGPGGIGQTSEGGGVGRPGSI